MQYMHNVVHKYVCNILLTCFFLLLLDEKISQVMPCFASKQHIIDLITLLIFLLLLMA